VRIGSIQIDPIVDGVAYLPIREPFMGMPVEAWEPHQQFLTSDAEVELALGGFLVRTGDRVVLVDLGVGTGTRTFRGGAFLDNLARAGVRADEVTDVVFSHLHFDHVGWAAHDDGRPVFEHATYRCDQRDWDFFMSPEAADDHMLSMSAPRLRPLASRMEFWSGGGTLLPGLDLMMAPGHTPGSTIMVLSSGVERAMLLGDVVHCPVELLDDEWAGLGDVDPALARRTKNALARELEGEDIPVAAAHFPGMQFGRLLPGEGTRRWVVG
jgi:glyoxylase-like metal-dependent hydrolase (beta-lactamase superfamily II)